jgi:hypothetical protein
MKDIQRWCDCAGSMSAEPDGDYVLYEAALAAIETVREAVREEVWGQFKAYCIYWRWQTMGKIRCFVNGRYLTLCDPKTCPMMNDLDPAAEWEATHQAAEGASLTHKMPEVTEEVEG